MVRLHTGHWLSYNSLYLLSETRVICRTWVKSRGGLALGEGLDDGSWITGLGAPSREAQRYVGVLFAPDPNGNAVRTTRAKISKRTRNLATKSKAWRPALGAGG